MKEKNKLIQMGVIQTSKYQALLVTDSSKAQEKGKSKKKEPKAADLKPKQNQQTSKGASGSKKKNFEKQLCPYCEKGYHLEDNCMRKQLDEISTLLMKHNIYPTRAKNPDEEPQIEDDERYHALKYSLTQSTTYLIYF